MNMPKVSTIGENAFKQCSSLTVNAMPMITSIGNSAFTSTGVTSIVLGNSLTSIGTSAFSQCTLLVSVNLGNSVTTIGASAFSGCTSLGSISVPNTVTSLPNYCFSGCTSLTSATLPADMTTLGTYVFQNCSFLTDVTMGYKITSMGANAFYNCSSLVTITLSSSLAGIPAYAFEGCTKLDSIVIPDSVTSIGVQAFKNCPLTDVTISKNVSTVAGNSFSVTFYNADASESFAADSGGIAGARFVKNGNRMCCVSGSYGTSQWSISDNVLTISGTGSTQDYIASSKLLWGYSFAEVNVESGITALGTFSFKNNTSISKLTLPDTLISVKGGAFDMISFFDSDGTTPLEANAANLAGNVFAGKGGQLQLLLPGLTVFYISSNNKILAPSHHEDITVGETYSISSPHVTGYVATVPTLEGTLLEETQCEYVTYTLGKYTLTVQFQYADGTSARNNSVFNNITFGYSQSFTVYTLTGYTTPGFTYSSSTVMDSEGKVVTVIYQPIDYQLNITYQYSNGSQAAEPYSQMVPYNSTYSVESPVIANYTPNRTVVSGTMYQGASIVVTYNVTVYNITATFVDNEGNPMGGWVIGTAQMNQTYSITTPTFSGYTPDIMTVSGIMDTEGKEVTITYTPIPYTLTVRYLFDSVEIFPAYSATVAYGKPYSVDSPSNDFYIPQTDTVSGNMIVGGRTINVYYDGTAATLKIQPVDANDNNIAEPTTSNVSFGDHYYTGAPSVFGYTADNPSIWVNIDSLNKEIKVVYTPNSHSVTITYTNSVVGYVFDTVTQTFTFGTSYSITSPSMPGYSPNYGTIEGTMEDSDLNFNVVYFIDKHDVTVNYVTDDGTQVSAPYTTQVAYGTTFNITSPQIANYIPNLSAVSGTMGVADLTFNVVYSLKTCIVTIFYVYSDGSVAANSKTVEVACGTDYNISSPAIAGYVADKNYVHGTIGTSDQSYQVTYTLDEHKHGAGGGSSSNEGSMSTIETVSIASVGVIAVLSLAGCIILFRRH